MQVEAIYRQGRLEFIAPLKLKHDTVRVLVEVPDAEIEFQADDQGLPPDVIARARAMREALDAIRDAPLPPDEELPEPTQKQQDRWEAFGLRENA
ncbi:hypothetical protein ABC977_15590 [Thioalkalicoccus limnaeus]|uniref:DUF104 domain-containing protein n=1 Tax=Thioalkalicoccus limnaeus TaxID=120681 RepID=A0ABV4BH25_9GAMM